MFGWDAIEKVSPGDACPDDGDLQVERNLRILLYISIVRAPVTPAKIPKVLDFLITHDSLNS